MLPADFCSFYSFSSSFSSSRHHQPEQTVIEMDKKQYFYRIFLCRPETVP